MKINATDYSLYSSGVQAHQCIVICKSGFLNPRADGAKEHEIELSIDENGSICLICEDGELRHIITAPFHIITKEGWTK